NDQPLEVFFDDFTVEHVHSAIVQADDYYPFGMTFNGYRRENSVANKFLYNGKELQDDLDLEWYDYGARFYDPACACFHRVDPIADNYAFQTPYAYAANNPIKYIDFLGLGPTSTHTDKDGNVIAVYNDGDLGVYRHEEAKTKADIDKSYSSDNTSAGGEKMGVTLAWWSFADPSDGENAGNGLGSINFGSYAARDWLNSTEPSGLIDYMTNAGTGRDEVYDYKSQGLSADATPDEIRNHQYRGSQISEGVYASARDVGNIFAGMYGSLFGTHKGPVLKAMGAFNANNNQLNWGLGLQLFKNWTAPYGEDYRSHHMQNVGFGMGVK